jgi:Uma2 family endonuclease
MAKSYREPDWISPEEYLAGEELAAVKHEYVAGRVFAMAGAKRRHNDIVYTLLGLLVNHLFGHRCRAYGSDFKVRTANDHFYYPDITVLCDEGGPDDVYTAQPRFVCEVLSESTRRTDETEKAIEYFQTPSIEAYVLIATEEACVRVLRRGGGDWWESEMLSEPDEVLRLDGLGFAVTLARIYQRTDLFAPDAG